MKSVIMIAYHFPPEGNAGSYRPLRFVRHLTAQDWQPTVITLKTDFYERYDPSLLSLVPNDVEVIRVANRDPWQAFQARRGRQVQAKLINSSVEVAARIQSMHQSPVRSSIRKLVHGIEACLYHPDPAMAWIGPTVRAIMQLCDRTRPDVIWATGSPWSSFAVARRVSDRTGIPYVLDFRDPWTMIETEFDARRPSWAKGLDRRILKKLFRTAQGIVLRSATEAECFWRAYYGALEATKIHLIPNGYEGRVDEFISPDGDKCNILYTGTLSDYRYDTLLQALSSIKKMSPDLASRLHFQFVGEGADAVRKAAADVHLSDMISTSGPVSQSEILRLSQKAHAFLLLERAATIKGHELLAGAKLFGYLKAGRPIFGVLPCCEARKVLERLGVSTIADVDSVADIVTVLRRLVHAWSSGRLLDAIPDPVACDAYSAERQTADLARVLEGSLPRRAFVPGSVEIPRSLQNEIGKEGWLSWA